MKKIKVVAAMSGGVDSSVAAALLKKAGHDVIGVTFKTWPKEECGASFGRACCSLESITRARSAAIQLKIPYYVIDFSDQFKKEVIDYFSAEYLKGRTPNPCVVCNSKIKFGLLAEKAAELGASFVATGHYVKSAFDKKSGRFLLKEGADKSKDQSYFLFDLRQAQLKRAIFPLAGLTKEKVRRLAEKMRLRAFDAVPSQDVCFIQDKTYAEYIKKKIDAEFKPGDIADSSGRILGRHKGIVHYTLGQRRGLGIAHSEPLYVVAIDVRANRVIVGAKRDVLKKRLVAERINWISRTGIDKPVRVMAKIRYNHKKARATIRPAGARKVEVGFDRPQEAPTPGQAVVFYDRDIVVGGGWIN